MPSLLDIEGVGPSLAAACVKKNYRTIAKIAAAQPSDLATVPGISANGASQIIASAKRLLIKSPLVKLPNTAKPIVKKKPRAVAPVKIETKAVAVQVPPKSSAKEKTMSVKEAKERIKKLKKKIKNLKTEKKRILAKENKKKKKKKATKKK